MSMPNVHAADKEPVSFVAPRTLVRRMKIRAQAAGRPWREWLLDVILHETQNVPLSSGDYNAIARATKQAERTGRQHVTPFNHADPKGRDGQVKKTGPGRRKIRK